MELVDFDMEYVEFKFCFGEYLDMCNFLFYKLYFKVYEEYCEYYDNYVLVRVFFMLAFFFGLKFNEEIIVVFDVGKSLLIKYINMFELDV